MNVFRKKNAYDDDDSDDENDYDNNDDDDNKLKLKPKMYKTFKIQEYKVLY